MSRKGLIYLPYTHKSGLFLFLRTHWQQVTCINFDLCTCIIYSNIYKYSMYICVYACECIVNNYSCLCSNKREERVTLRLLSNFDLFLKRNCQWRNSKFLYFLSAIVLSVLVIFIAATNFARKNSSRLQ